PRTNFILPGPRQGEEIYERLLHEGVVGRKASGLGLKGFLRVTVGLPEENEFFVSSLKKVLVQLG
ncbi:MAG TPA: histidinol-phosphate transaminase, partial [Synergistaceae bacterium]|nr:histidinol-phosphate transaminase [Synergistaceae bacterium]